MCSRARFNGSGQVWFAEFGFQNPCENGLFDFRVISTWSENEAASRCRWVGKVHAQAILKKTAAAEKHCNVGKVRMSTVSPEEIRFSTKSSNEVIEIIFVK